MLPYVCSSEPLHQPVIKLILEYSSRCGDGGMGLALISSHICELISYLRGKIEETEMRIRLDRALRRVHTSFSKLSTLVQGYLISKKFWRVGPLSGIASQGSRSYFHMLLMGLLVPATTERTATRLVNVLVSLRSKTLILFF